MQWYALFIPRHTEEKIKGMIKEWLRSLHREKELGAIVHPKEKITIHYYWRERVFWQPIFPNYLFLQMEPELFPLVQSLLRDYFPRAHPLGKDPFLFQKVEKILDDRINPPPPPPLSVAQGDKVQVKDGPFAGFSGEIDFVDQHKQKLRVIVNIFGRKTPIELPFSQVEKTK